MVNADLHLIFCLLDNHQVTLVFAFSISILFLTDWGRQGVRFPGVSLSGSSTLNLNEVRSAVLSARTSLKMSRYSITNSFNLCTWFSLLSNKNC